MDIHLVSVIVLNWNGICFIEDCLNSLVNQSYKDFEIIVVDNGSTDGSVELLKKKFMNRIKLIENEKNLGFSGGNNSGIRISEGDFILLLNNDAVADKKWIEELVNVASKDPTIGMCASKILSYENRNIIDNVGHLIYRDGLNRGKGRLEEDKGQYDKEEEVFFPSGCAALYRKKMLDEIGLFDEDFFIGIRARMAGWKCIYVPTAVVFHRYSGSSSAYSELKAFYVERNRVWVAVKYLPISMLLASLYYTLIRFILQAYGAATGRGASGKFVKEYSRGKLLLVLFKAYFSAFKGIGKMWEKRKRIKSLKKVPHDEIEDWFIRYGISAREIALKE